MSRSPKVNSQGWVVLKSFTKPGQAQSRLEELFDLSNTECTMVIFGGAGDLSHRKLVPALYNLHRSGQLSSGFSLFGVDRKQKSTRQYRDELAASVEQYSESSWSSEEWEKIEKKIFYESIDLQDPAAYLYLKEMLDNRAREHHSGNNHLYYLAVSPPLFAIINSNLRRLGLSASSSGWRRIMIEKPFGHDLTSATELNSAISAAFGEEDIYRIDHYLGKEMLQNTMVIRFANTIFEPLWNNNYIDHIQISAAESDGIGDRGRYYDQTGAMRDMVQSHLFQLLTVTAMEPPGRIDADTVRWEKLKLLKNVHLWPGSAASEKIIFGQYSGFLKEKDINARSQTETFAALKLAIDNERWQGVPFYLRIGKKLEDKLVKIVIQFKDPPDPYAHLLPGSSISGRDKLFNLLTLKVQPREGAVLQFNIKKPATVTEIVPAEMDFCQPCAFLINTPEAYERLLKDAMVGDKTRFSAWDEIERAWKVVDSIYKVYNRAEFPMQSYEPGSTGPQAAGEMLGREGRRWWY